MLYSLVGDNIPFSVAMDGFITVSGEIDFETTHRFRFQIRATNPIAVSEYNVYREPVSRNTIQSLQSFQYKRHRLIRIPDKEYTF